MTDPITQALTDLDSAVGSIDSELSTVVNMVQQLQAQLASGSTTDAAAIAAQIEQRVSTLQGAVSAAQGSLSSAQSAAPSSGDTSSTPPADSGTAADTGASTDTSGDTSTPPASDTSSTGSPMG